MKSLISGTRSRRTGFTFVEVLVAAGVLIIFSATALAALTQFNRYAYAARLRAHALSLAQQRIDEVLTVTWRTGVAERPAILNPGTRTESNLVINADDKNNQTALKSEFTALATPVSGTRVTQITALTTRTLRADVTVNFVYAGRNYSIALSTIRATDTI
jgi:type II secretory pathway pseudopilin PulG